VGPTFNSSWSTAGYFVSVYEFGAGMGVLCRGQGDAIGLLGLLGRLFLIWRVEASEEMPLGLRYAPCVELICDLFRFVIPSRLARAISRREICSCSTYVCTYLCGVYNYVCRHLLASITERWYVFINYEVGLSYVMIL
jgi:hypothetical protein